MAHDVSQAQVMDLIRCKDAIHPGVYVAQREFPGRGSGFARGRLAQVVYRLMDAKMRSVHVAHRHA